MAVLFNARSIPHLVLGLFNMACQIEDHLPRHARTREAPKARDLGVGSAYLLHHNRKFPGNLAMAPFSGNNGNAASDFYL